MQNAFDLFGNLVQAVPAVTVAKPKVPSKPRAKKVIDRRELWVDGGYLAQIEEQEDDASLNTTESFTENATIERLEQSLQMAPVIRGGKWVYEGTFWAYKIVKPVIGTRTFGSPQSILRTATLFLVQSNAQKVLDETYNDTGAWLPRYAYWVFCARLRIAHESEDPYALLQAFTAVLTQHDYLDASRKGDSLRRIAKREHMRAKRAALRGGAGNDAEDADEVDDRLSA